MQDIAPPSVASQMSSIITDSMCQGALNPLGLGTHSMISFLNTCLRKFGEKEERSDWIEAKKWLTRENGYVSEPSFHIPSEGARHIDRESWLPSPRILYPVTERYMYPETC